MTAVKFFKKLSKNINHESIELEDQSKLFIDSVLNYCFEYESAKILKYFDDLNISYPNNFNLNEIIQTPYDLVSEFLNSIGQKNYIIQAESIYNKLDEIKMNRRSLIKTFYNTIQ